MILLGAPATLVAIVGITSAFAAPHDTGRWNGWKHGEDPVRQLYQYPVGTWVENIAIRPSGELLVSLLTTPRVDQIDPFDPNAEPETVYTFPNASGATGIAEIDHDIFTTTVGNFSLSGGSQAGSWSAWKLDLSNDQKSVTKITDFPELTFPNGMCNLHSPSKPEDILIGDIDEGKIWRVDTSTGEYEVAIENELTKTAPNSVFGTVGVNGIHVHDGTLYLTNTGRAFFAQIPIHPNGTPAGPGRVISYFSNTIQYADDFTLQGDSAYLVTGSGNSIEKVSLDGSHKEKVIAGSPNSTEIAEPTACAFGRTERDCFVLYVVTAGGLASPIDGDVRVGAQVLAVDTRRWRGWEWGDSGSVGKWI